MLPERGSQVLQNTRRILNTLQQLARVIGHRKLRTYEEIHTGFARYLRSDGIYRFLSAGGNDRYGRIR